MRECPKCGNPLHEEFCNGEVRIWHCLCGYVERETLPSFAEVKRIERRKKREEVM